jgi:hypothetical protein
MKFILITKNIYLNKIYLLLYVNGKKAAKYKLKYLALKKQFGGFESVFIPPTSKFCSPHKIIERCQNINDFQSYRLKPLCYLD